MPAAYWSARSIVCACAVPAAGSYRAIVSCVPGIVSASRLAVSGWLAIQPGAVFAAHAVHANVTRASQPRDDIDANEHRMHIAIIGSGHIGGGLGRAWAAKGHAVVFGAREPGDPDLKVLLDETGATAATIADAVRGAEVVALA